MLSKLLRSTIARVVLPVGRALDAAGISANFLTVLGFLVVAGACVFVARGRLFLGGWVLLGGAVFDLLDGAVAKAAGSPTKAGAFLDSTLDRLSDGLVSAAVAWQFVSPLFPGAPVALLAAGAPQRGFALALASLILGFLISYIRARAESLGFECAVGIVERSERVIIVAVGLLFGVLVPALAVLVALSFVTVVQRFVHVWKQARGASPA